MAKNHRGTGVRTMPSRGRGECPVCKKTGIKAIYEVEIDGNKVMVCKFCSAALKNKARKAARAQKAVATPAPEAAPAESVAPAENAAPEAAAE